MPFLGICFHVLLLLLLLLGRALFCLCLNVLFVCILCVYAIAVVVCHLGDMDNSNGIYTIGYECHFPHSHLVADIRFTH